MEEIWLHQFEVLERPISELGRKKLLDQLDTVSVDDSCTRGEWYRDGFERPLSYVSLAEFTIKNPKLFSPDETRVKLRSAQASFVRSFDWYLSGFTDAEMQSRELFELLRKVGTSAYWPDDESLVRDLNGVFCDLDLHFLRPWDTDSPVHI